VRRRYPTSPWLRSTFSTKKASTSHGPCFTLPAAADAADAAVDATGVAAGAAADAESAAAGAVDVDAEDADGVAAAAAVAVGAGVCLGVDAGPGAELSQHALGNLFVCGPEGVAIRPLCHVGGRCGTLGPLDRGKLHRLRQMQKIWRKTSITYNRVWRLGHKRVT
jgi:hypothetical protein